MLALIWFCRYISFVPNKYHKRHIYSLQKAKTYNSENYFFCLATFNIKIVSYTNNLACLVKRGFAIGPLFLGFQNVANILWKQVSHSSPAYITEKYKLYNFRIINIIRQIVLYSYNHNRTDINSHAICYIYVKEEKLCAYYATKQLHLFVVVVVE